LNRTRAHYLLAVVAGAALPLAFAPFELFFVAPLSYAALLYVWTDAAPRRALGLSFAWGCASFGLGTYWTPCAHHRRRRSRRRVLDGQARRARGVRRRGRLGRARWFRTRAPSPGS
jgi:apolipoprotein N-acyltransferase